MQIFLSTKYHTVSSNGSYALVGSTGSLIIKIIRGEFLQNITETKLLNVHQL